MQTLDSKFKLGQDRDLEEFLAYSSGERKGIATGLESFDSALLGLRGLVLFVGQPKTCKSTLALQIALKTALSGGPVFYIDRENGKRLVEERLICNKNMLSERGFRLRPPANKMAMYRELGTLPFYLCDGNFDQQLFAEYAAQMIELYPNAKTIFFVVDSLHKIPGIDYTNPKGSLDSWLVFFDGLVNKHGSKITILLICEKNRSSYGEGQRASTKDTGRAEFTAHQLFDMFTPEGKEDEIYVKCMYNRYGKMGQSFRLEKEFAGGPTEFVYRLKEFRRNAGGLSLE